MPAYWNPKPETIRKHMVIWIVGRAMLIFTFILSNHNCCPATTENKYVNFPADDNDDAMILMLMTIYCMVNCIPSPCRLQCQVFAGSTGSDYVSSVIRKRGVLELLS